MLTNPNYFVGNPLDRRSEYRGDDDWLKEQEAHPKAQMLVFWRGMPLLEDGPDKDTLRPLMLSPAARSEFAPQANVILLGFQEETPFFAIDGSATGTTPENAPFSDLGTYGNLRDIAMQLERQDLAIIGQAVWMLDWHRRHSFCANCGAADAMGAGGIKRICNNCDTEHFPRTDPVAIVLPVCGNKCLLGRGPHFPPNMFSALAGFLEAGETLEECAIREVAEETGVTVKNPRYIFSQPWPFPSSLMTGFIAEADDMTLNLDTREIEEARWVTKDDIKALINGERRPDLWIPPPYAIARQLLEYWVQS